MPNRRALFANESDGYKTTSAPSAFRSSCGRSAWIGEEPTPEQSERHYRNCHQEDYLTAEQPDVAAVIEEVQLKCFNAKTETSSAADPATDFRPFANSPRSLANNFRIDTSPAASVAIRTCTSGSCLNASCIFVRSSGFRPVLPADLLFISIRWLREHLPKSE